MGDGGSNGAISGSNKSKMAAAAILEKFQMAISPQQLTIYLYSAHRAVIFAIAQLSCCLSSLFSMVTTNAAVRSHRQPMVEGLKLEIHRLLCSFNACIGWLFTCHLGNKN